MGRSPRWGRFTKGQQPVTCWNVEFETPELCGLNLGDEVLCTRNLWDKGLQNGSLGRVVEVAPTATAPSDEGPVQELAWVEWDDGTRRPITHDMLDDIELGYAVTVHKAQGSQWPRVIIPVSASKLLDRTLLYTAVTRAQVQVILVGDAAAARRAVLAQPRAQERNVALDLALQRRGHHLDAATSQRRAAALCWKSAASWRSQSQKALTCGRSFEV